MSMFINQITLKPRYYCPLKSIFYKSWQNDLRLELLVNVNEKLIYNLQKFWYNIMSDCNTRPF
jgi:hypothetical protein